MNKLLLNLLRYLTASLIGLLISYNSWAVGATPFDHLELTLVNVQYSVNSEATLITAEAQLQFKFINQGPVLFHFDGTIDEAYEINQGRLKKIQLTNEVLSLSKSRTYRIDGARNKGDYYNLLLRYKLHPSLSRFFDSKKLAFGTRFNNIDGVGPEQLTPLLNIPRIRPAYSIKVTFDESFPLKTHRILCGCSYTLAQNSVEFNFGTSSPLQGFFYILPISQSQNYFESNTGSLKLKVLVTEDSFAPAQITSEFKRTATLIDESVRKLEKYLGPYPHGQQLTAFMIYPRGVSMEYRGAFVSVPDLVTHELIHQWIATDLSPTHFNDIWLIEAMTVFVNSEILGVSESWNGPLPVLTEQSPVYNLAAASAHFEGYSRKSYTYGVSVLRLIDSLLKLKSAQKLTIKILIPEFYNQHRQHPITSQDFVDFLKQRAPEFDWAKLLNRLVFNNTAVLK